MAECLFINLHPNQISRVSSPFPNPLPCVTEKEKDKHTRTLRRQLYNNDARFHANDKCINTIMTQSPITMNKSQLHLWGQIDMFASPDMSLHVLPTEWSDLCAGHRGGRWRGEWRDTLGRPGVCPPAQRNQRRSKVWLDKGRPGELCRGHVGSCRAPSAL